MTHPTQPLTKNLTCEWAQGGRVHLRNCTAAIKIWKEAWRRPCFFPFSYVSTSSSFSHSHLHGLIFCVPGFDGHSRGQRRFSRALEDCSRADLNGAFWSGFEGKWKVTSGPTVTLVANPSQGLVSCSLAANLSGFHQRLGCLEWGFLGSYFSCTTRMFGPSLQ